MREKIYNKFDRRIGCLQSIFYITCAALVLYLFLLQVFDIRHCKNKAKSQRASKMYVLRGEIVDRYGFKLAADKTTFVLYAHPAYYDYSPSEFLFILLLILGTISFLKYVSIYFFMLVFEKLPS